jgi:amino acid adenylation domain-containing protein
MRVGICLERGVELLVGLLGILRAGAAYVPIDPAYPARRRELMLRSSQATLVVTSAATRELVGSRTPVDVDAAGDAAAQLPVADPRALAYVMYTSGSTGAPKGVMIEHRHVAAMFRAMDDVLGSTVPRTWAAVTSVCFDISILELLYTLARGYRVVVLPTGASPGELARVLERYEVTHLQCTPSLARPLVADQRCRAALARIDCMLVGGEVLPAPLAGELRTALRGRLINVYGPTETTIWSTWHEVGDEHPVPIGRPLANTRVWLVDGGALAAPEAVAELWIGGDSVARGYLGQPELTSERFVPAPDGQGRAYRTGDHVRLGLDGVLHFVGRADQQVKVRGHRLELGEIEAALAELPGVGEAAVVARGHQDMRLVAYVVRKDQAVDVAALRDGLATRLPEFAIPTTFVMLEQMPRTANNKIDRRALPEPDEAAVSARAAGRPPQTPLECELASRWSRELGGIAIGRDEAFLDLGGESLIAMRLLSSIHELTGVELTVRQFFEARTVAGLAATIDDTRARGGTSERQWPVVASDRARRHEPFALSDVQQAYWMGRSEDVELGGFSMHSYVELELPELDVPRLEIALDALVRRHDMLRAVVLPDGRQRILETVPRIRVPVTDLRSEPPAAVERRLADERARLSHQVLALVHWPLFEVQVFQLGGAAGGAQVAAPAGSRFRIAISVDGIMLDAGSVAILAGELQALYRDPGRALPPLELSFRDYVVAEQAHQQTPMYRASLDYWKRRIATLPAAPELPLVPVGGPRPTFRRRVGALSADQWSVVRRRGIAAGLTPSGILLAAYAEVLAAWSKHSRLVINVTLFNRLPVHPQVNDVVGDFTSLVLLEASGGRDVPFVDRARQAQSQLWADLDHRRVSGVSVLRELGRHQPGRALAPVVFTSTLGGGTLPMTGHGALPEEIYGLTQTPQVVLDHMVGERDGALIWNWDSVDAAFPPGCLDAMHAAYVRLLERLAADETAWTELTRTLTPSDHAERHRARNATATAQPHQRLEDASLRQAAAQPKQTAVVSGLRRLSYDELLQRSNQVVAHLAKLGVRRGELVAVLCQKGWEQIVGALGALRAGAAYLPLDPEWPAERLGHIFRACDVRFALTQSQLGRITWPDGVQRIPVDLLRPLRAELATAGTPDDLAYVIFTSGSTGTPKGVMLDHAGPVNTIADLNARFGIGAGDRVLALSALTFDLSVYDIFGMLAAGGRVVMPPPEDLREPKVWLEIMEREGVTVWNTVPALMEMLVSYIEASTAPVTCPLRLVMMSGDWIPVALPERIRKIWPQAQIVSLGGATEASIWSILYPIDAVAPAWKSIPYGHAMANQTMHVLDGMLETRPDLVPGEIYIGGVGVAQGYWRDPELTAAKFLTHPRTGERLYRTGDWGRYLSDGEIEFLGRDDFQVKIHGFRVELGEIEATLAAHPEVAQAIALVSAQRGPKIVAFVAKRSAREPARGGATPGADAIELADFRLQRHGLRRGLAGPRVPLGGAAAPLGRERRTERTFSTQRCSLDQLGSMLACLAEAAREDEPLPKLRYPSAGSLYPVQVYLHVKPDRVDGLPGGTHFYDRESHQLVQLAPGVELARDAHTPVNRPIFDEAAFSLFFVARDAAIAPIYGERARDFCLIEAGYMGQLVMQAAIERGIGLCPIGYLDFAAIVPHLALEPGQWLVHSFLGGASRDLPAELLVRELRQLLRRRLPWYMEPASIQVLDALPLSSNGKVDRKALAELAARTAVSASEPRHATSASAASPAAAGADSPAPASTTAARIAEIMARVLGLERIGHEDSFFELGGTSVLAARVIATVRSMFGADVTLRVLFDRPSPRAFAAAVDAQQPSVGAVDAPASEAARAPTTIPRVPRKPGG